MNSVDMSGKTCVVTGATAGIGEATARALAAMGAQVLLVARNQERGQAAMARIRAATPEADIAFFAADLSSQAAVRELAATIRRHYARLDVLVNNAGAIFAHRQESVDGIEMTFALNHLSYFLLTSELLPLLQASAPARVVTVASGMYTLAHMNFDDLQSRRSYQGFAVYARSKLANILWTNELARRLEGTGVTANSLHPGSVASNFNQNNPHLLTRMAWLAGRLVALSPAQGAETSIYLATAPELARVSGTYFVRKTPILLQPRARDAAAARTLWEISEQLTQQSRAVPSQA